ncbi:MAG: VOC family protein [Rhizobiaceae bacterium]|nr:VOC family protein [Rhizobiaceae bacterium]
MMPVLDHIHLKANAADPVAAFFELLGATLVRRELRQGKVRIGLDIGGTKISVDEDAVGENRKSPFGYNHIALSVSDVDGEIERLRNGGITVSTEPYWPLPNIRAAFVTGPEGIVVELIDRHADR